MKNKLLGALLSRKKKIGNLSAATYEKALGRTWDLFYKGRKITYLGEKEFGTTAWGEDAWGEEGFQSLNLCYSYLDTDTLLDLYHVLLDMETHFEEQRAQAFWEELGLKKLISKEKQARQSTCPSLNEVKKNKKQQINFSTAARVKLVKPNP